MKALAPVRTAAPAEALLSLADAKAHLRVDLNDEDALITSLVAAAETHLDGYSGVLGRALITQSWERSFDRFPCERCLRLPLGRLQDVTEIRYFDSAGVLRSFADFHEATDALGPMVVLTDGASWPDTARRPDAVTVAWTCGYGSTAADVPGAIIAAAKLLIGHWYDHRQAVNVGNISSELPLGAQHLLTPYRAVCA